jgi:ribose/xylose/arabinose/galactoside ABC-type transport system permease subunit
MMADVTSGKTWPSFLGATAFREYGIYIALVVLIIYFSILVPEFRTWNNALLILLQVSVIGIIAVGMTFTIITAGIDLSVGSLLAVAGIMSGLFAQRDPTAVNVALAFAVPIAVGLLGGALNGAIIAGAGVNPLIVTLGTLTAFRGFVVWYRVNPIYDLQSYYRSLCSFWCWWQSPPGSPSASRASVATFMPWAAIAKPHVLPASMSGLLRSLYI